MIKRIEIEKINEWTYDISVNDIYLRYGMIIDEETQTYTYGEIALIQPTAQELNDFILEMHEREN